MSLMAPPIVVLVAVLESVVVALPTVSVAAVVFSEYGVPSIVLVKTARNW